jgi:hypothetical protein
MAVAARRRGNTAVWATAPGTDRQGAHAVGDATQLLIDVVPFDADVGEDGIGRDRFGEEPVEVTVCVPAVLEEAETADGRAVGQPSLADQTARGTVAQRLGGSREILLQLLAGDGGSERDNERVHLCAAFLRHSRRRRSVRSCRCRL